MWSGARSGFFTQVAEGIFPSRLQHHSRWTTSAFQQRDVPNSLCDDFVCMAPGVNIYGQSVTPPPPFNVVQVVHNFQTPMNHAYNLTVEQQITNKIVFQPRLCGNRWA